ncbi:MAG TPA: endonuclease MutS2 [Ignavibacteria bacterium]|nr:endonuclease MutS2 [Ignavibacteria bacterium]
MLLQETKIKLEFDKILDNIRHYTFSDLGSSFCDEIEFITSEILLNKELDKVVEIKTIIVTEGDIPLDGLKDIRKSLSKLKIEGYFISPEEFLHILNCLRVSRKLKRFVTDLIRNEPGSYKLTSELVEDLFFDKALEHNIESTIDDNGNVKDSASSNLSKIRKTIISNSGRLKKTLSGILKKDSDKEYTQEEFVTQREDRYVIPVKVENKRNVPGIIHSSSSSGATVFIEPSEIINLNNELTELHFEEKREIEKILRDLALLVVVHYEKMKLNIDLLSEIDFIQAKARYALETDSSKPVITDKHLSLVKTYHPILLKSAKRSEVVPLNLFIGDNYNTLVISGPNAGGKTVVLKTVGLIQLMLQSGILVPANPESEFRLFKKIFISIGDEQSLDNDLSTFSSHLKSIKEIIDESDENSLILIDEIASGTDPVLGSALSASILKNFSANNSYTIVTTHNSELKQFAYNTDKIENASLEFDVNTLSPNFNFITGVPGQSFTFEIAKKFKFPESIIKEAYNNLDQNESRLEDLLKDLNDTKQRYNLLKNKFDIDNSRLQGLTKMYDQKLSEIKKNEKELKFKAKFEAERIIKDANKLIEKTIKEIKENKLTPKEIKSDFKKEAEIITDIGEAEEEIIVVNENINISDSVRLKDSNTTGEVIEILNDTVSVNVNGLLLKLKKGDLEKISRKEVKKEYSQSSNVELYEGSIDFSLDLRGKYTGEIEDIVEKFIYDSINHGLKEVSIIHGKGSGKLRTEVNNLLRKNKRIKSYRIGNWNEGDTGVTIIEL